MQNRYVGDIGDYLKLGILRALSPGYRLGVAWWLFPDEAHNGDGRHIGYLNHPEQWRHFDPDLFDILVDVVSSGQRNLRALEASDILPGAIFAGEVIRSDGPLAQRQQVRREWFVRMKDSITEADLLFVDPDNGLEPAGYSHGSAKAGKSVLLSELHELARPGRCLIVYHHHSRRKGGHQCENRVLGRAASGDRIRYGGRPAGQTVLSSRVFSPKCAARCSTPSRSDFAQLAGIDYMASRQIHRWRR